MYKNLQDIRIVHMVNQEFCRNNGFDSEKFTKSRAVGGVKRMCLQLPRWVSKWGIKIHGQGDGI